MKGIKAAKNISAKKNTIRWHNPISTLELRTEKLQRSGWQCATFEKNDFDGRETFYRIDPRASR